MSILDIACSDAFFSDYMVFLSHWTNNLCFVAQLEDITIPASSISEITEIGEGEFGRVVEAIVENLPHHFTGVLSTFSCHFPRTT